MSRYFFNVIDGKFLVDEEGTECSGMPEVREQAITFAGSLLRDEAGRFPTGVEWQMHVTDQAKLTVLKITFSVEEPLARS